MSKYRQTNNKSVFLIIGALSAVAIVGIGFVALNESKSQAQVATYATTASSRPKAVVASTFSDFGTMKVTDEKTAEFTIENTGDKPLQFFKVTSSCGCTFGTITINGIKSPEFSMHSKSNWTGELLPRQKASISVIYKPSIMPVKGEVTRTVYVSTNDPDNKELAFSVKAFVE